MPGDPVRVCFGDRCTDGSLVGYTSELKQDLTVIVRLSAHDIGSQPYDYAALLRVHRLPSDPEAAKREPYGGLIFTGYVERAELSDREVLVHGAAMTPLRQGRMRGIYMQIPHAEMFWSICRIGGLSEREININSRDWPQPEELWLVMAPVAGLRPREPLRVQDVVIAADPRIALLFEDAREELRTHFRQTGVWAAVPVKARTAFDAEVRGLSLIGNAVARISLLARFALSTSPSGSPRVFRHTQLTEGIEILPVVGAQATGSARRWLREPGLLAERVDHDESVVDGLTEALRASDPRLDLAIGAWRRATREENTASCVVALAEALEFYVAETSVPGLFSAAELTDLAQLQKDQPWTPEQKGRFKWAIGRLNEAPFGSRFARALERDQVVLSPEERQLLEELRSMRNDILHGRARPEIGPDNRRRALALIGRMLVFRAERLASEPNP